MIVRRVAGYFTLLGVLLVASSAHAEDDMLRLEDAIRLAESRNERAQISTLNVASAEAAVAKARAAFFPTLTLVANDSQRPLAPGPSQPTNVATGSVTLTQPLLNLPALPLYSQAKEALNAQKAQTADDKRLLAFDAARSFISVLSANAVLEAAKRRVGTATANLQDTQARVQAQLTSSNDATRASLDVATAQRVVESNKGALATQTIQLGFVINAPVPEKLVSPDATIRAAKEPITKVDELVRLATQRRPDLDAKQKLVAAAQQAANEPLLRLAPTVNASAQVQLTSNAGASGRLNDEIFGVSLSWSIFDGGGRYADKHARDTAKQIADLTTRALIRDIDAQVRVAVTNLTTSRAAFDLAEKEVAMSQKNAEETAILYRQGLAKAIELVDATDSKFLAEVNFAGSEYALAQAYLDLRQALGLEPLGTELK